MELKMNNYQLPEAVSFNFEELKQGLTESVKKYEPMVYTEDNIKEAKADRANLNKLKKALNDERIRQEKEYMKPFNEFKAQINEIIAIIDKPVMAIDSCIKEYEQEQKKQKEEEIRAIFEEEAKNAADEIRLERIFSDKWLNASVSLKKVQEEIKARISQFNADLETLSKLPEFSFEAIEDYKVNLDLNRAIVEGQRLADIQRRKEEAEKAKLQAEEAKKETENIQPVAEPVESTPIESTYEPKEWIRFKAYLSADDARALRQFCDSRKIEIKAI